MRQEFLSPIRLVGACLAPFTTTVRDTFTIVFNQVVAGRILGASFNFILVGKCRAGKEWAVMIDAQKGF
jgi:hypothetical protein